jgi:hypothetical protein
MVRTCRQQTYRQYEKCALFEVIHDAGLHDEYNKNGLLYQESKQMTQIKQISADFFCVEVKGLGAHG